MKRNILLIATILIATTILNAQKVDPKHENHFKVPDPIITKEYTINFFDVQAQTEFCKLAIKVTNNTNDFILFEKGASTFNFDFGKFSDPKKELVIGPNGSKKKVLTAKGNQEFHVEKFNMTIDGLSIVPVKGEVNKMEDFQVPASKNSIETAVFKVSLKKSSLRTQEASLVFECIYQGNKIAMIDPSKLVIKVDGADKEYANDNKKSESKLLRKGDKFKVKAVFHISGRVADMQFANMTILWKDTFVETEARKLDKHEVNFELDRGLTIGKNQ
jgi:hypothetical protein